MGSLQRWIAPQWGGQGRSGVAGILDNPGGYACEVVRCAEREIQVTIRPSAGRRTHSSPAAPLECREMHLLPVGDPPARPTRHQFL